MPEPVVSMIAAAMLDAAIGLVTDRTVGERLKSWRTSRRQRRSFEGALERAFTEFRFKHADLVASLFDARFVKEVAAPELAKLLTRSEEPDVQRVAAAYASQFGKAIVDVTNAVIDLIAWVLAQIGCLDARAANCTLYGSAKLSVGYIHGVVRVISRARRLIY